MEDRERIRLSYLESMGIQAWSLRWPSAPIEAADEGNAASPPEASDVESIAPESLPPHLANAVESRLGASSLALTGKSSFATPTPFIVNSTVLPPAAHFVEKPSSIKRETGEPEPGLGWDELQARVASCTACALHQTRTQTVFGVGDRCADWMVIGEAPGEQEDLQGEPFVGRAGLLLNEMLRAIGLERGQVYIANILKCRPPKNRDPQVEEASACEGHLKQQLALVKPKIVLAVGRIAAQNLLKTTTPIGKLRGVVHDYQGVPLVVVYHPAYLLRSPLEKRRAFDDLRLALHTYRQTL
jgi:uracil-DNA glycosylase family 4